MIGARSELAVEALDIGVLRRLVCLDQPQLDPPLKPHASMALPVNSALTSEAHRVPQECHLTRHCFLFVMRVTKKSIRPRIGISE